VTPKTGQRRLDALLVDLGIAPTRVRAQNWIKAGKVCVNGTPVFKPAERTPLDARIDIDRSEREYVSRAALKLIAALDTFNVPVKNRVAIDIGASTGGFTEVLLERGVKTVHALDVGSGQLAEKIRNHPSVRVKENYNARDFRPEDFPCRFDLLVMDVSFISIRLVIPAVLQGLEEECDLLVLFKPQFEVGRDSIGAGGIVEDQEKAKKVLGETLDWARELGLDDQGTHPSPIKGGDGNQEYLIHWKKGPPPHRAKK
jgi:23S rRNA (cytidine1920-2'-O)/16S rRNA (cytidine1409-2'-O)-methyltransferase